MICRVGKWKIYSYSRKVVCVRIGSFANLTLNSISLIRMFISKATGYHQHMGPNLTPTTACSMVPRFNMYSFSMTCWAVREDFTDKKYRPKPQCNLASSFTITKTSKLPFFNWTDSWWASLISTLKSTVVLKSLGSQPMHGMRNINKYLSPVCLSVHYLLLDYCMDFIKSCHTASYSNVMGFR